MDFSKKLITWYLDNKRDLPWRKTKNPYFVWLSEIILQQTRIAQGLSYYLKFAENFPTIFDLAKADESKVLKLWQGLGYYSRARNLHYTAKKIVKEYNGEFPSTYKDIIELKGIGDYTASAISSICFDEPNAVVDGNVYRVLSRFFGVETAINSSKGIKEFKILAQSLIDEDQPGVFNQAIMDFGSIQCKPKNPNCMFCPFSESCFAYQKNKIENLPFKEKKLKIKKRYLNFLVTKTENKKTYIQKREGKGIWQGLYQFPIVESNKLLTKEELLITEEFNNLYPYKTTLSLFNKKEIIHKLSHQHLHSQFWIIETSKIEEAQTDWNEIEKYAVPVLISRFLNEYLEKSN